MAFEAEKYVRDKISRENLIRQKAIKEGVKEAAVKVLQNGASREFVQKSLVLSEKEMNEIIEESKTGE